MPSEFSKRFEICCGWSGRTIITLIVAGGIVCSVYTALSCEFFQFEVEPEHELPGPIFVNITEGYVGLFGFSLINETCVSEEQGFLPAGFNELFFAAQVCAIVAPLMAIVALLLNLLEICCRLRGTFTLMWLCLLLAVGAQGCTFMVYGQQEFCFSDGAIDCDLGTGAILSMVAAGTYYMASIILCCMPRTEPFFYKYDAPRTTSRPKDDSSPTDGLDDEQPQPPSSSLHSRSFEDEPSQGQEEEYKYHDEPEISFGHGGTHATESFQNYKTGAGAS